MLPSRRSYLCLLSVAVTGGIAGCLGRQGPPENCPAETLTPVPYPDLPNTLTKESVRSFVKAVERAYVYTDHAERDHVYVSFDPEPESVTRMKSGWEARIETSLTAYACQDGSLGSGHAAYTAYYFVNESAVYRAESGDEREIDPREDGRKMPIGE